MPGGGGGGGGRGGGGGGGEEGRGKKGKRLSIERDEEKERSCLREWGRDI